jgi:hypothetical protein
MAICPRPNRKAGLITVVAVTTRAATRKVTFGWNALVAADVLRLFLPMATLALPLLRCSLLGLNRLGLVLTSIGGALLILAVLWLWGSDPAGYYDPRSAGAGVSRGTYIEFKGGSIFLVTPEMDGNPRAVSPFGFYGKSNEMWYWRGDNFCHEIEVGLFSISTKEAGVPTGDTLSRTYPSLLMLESWAVELEEKLRRLAIED